MTKTYLDELTYEIIGCAIEVHKIMGILINFNCSNIFQQGRRTFVNEYFNSLPCI